MTNDNSQALNIFSSICSLCDEIGLTYERSEDELLITMSITGEDLPMKMGIFVRPDRELVKLISPMPFTVTEDRRVDLAVAVAYANYGLADGCFDYDIADGTISYRITAPYAGSILGKEVFRYMIYIASKAVDYYNDKFLMLSKSMITLEQFIHSTKDEDK
ncbi:MAG: hypothetical protein KBI35_09710 [Ruminococcus sp.]|nr:hypothetical protein [Ruminococcus sp.]MBQ3857011.1 hypothetical protein [Ruminococcus sp.]